MYILWSRGSEILNFPMDYERNGTSHRHKREGHSESHMQSHSPHRNDANNGLVMTQLLRADKLVIPEK